MLLAALAIAAALCGSGRCDGAQLTGQVHESQGAAGTIAHSLVFENTSPDACVLHGFPKLKLEGAPTRTRHGGIAFLEKPAKWFVLRPGKKATLLVAAGDVPVGSETTCPSAHALYVRPPHSTSRARVSVDITACDRGLLRESPFLKGVHGLD